MVTATQAISSLIPKIEKLRLRTVDRGASEAEADTSARIIGRALMENPELQIVIGGGDQQQRIDYPPDTEWVTISGCRCIADARMAILVDYRGVECWIPRSQINWSETEIDGRGDFGSVVVAEWFFDKEISHRLRTAGAC